MARAPPKTGQRRLVGWRVVSLATPHRTNTECATCTRHVAATSRESATSTDTAPPKAFGTPGAILHPTPTPQHDPRHFNPCLSSRTREGKLVGTRQTVEDRVVLEPRVQQL